MQSVGGTGQGGGVSEILERARRWSGYVCPDCRFVFRVSRDHDGQGIVCPSCRRMLRIPTATDIPPPLLGPSGHLAALEPAGEGRSHRSNKRRRGKKAKGAESHSWEKLPKSARSERSEKRQMRLMLIGGASLFALIVGGVIVSMNGGNKAAGGGVSTPVSAAKNPEAVAVQAVVPRGEASILAEAEPLTRKFMAATTVEELLPLVRNPGVAEGRMRAFYPGGKVEAVGLSQFNAGGALAIVGKIISLVVTTRDHEQKSLALIDTPEGLKIDWESWVGWSEISWEKFLSSRPVTGHVFRVTLSPVEYYNFGFTDDSKWQSYRLESADKEHSIYGYVEKGSVLDHRIHPNSEAKNTALMLSLKFPAGAASDSQVEIERYAGEGWVEEEVP